MGDSVNHVGTVTAVAGNIVTVTLDDNNGDCSGCAAVMLCHPASGAIKSGKRTVTVEQNNNRSFRQGDRVKLHFSTMSRLSAICIALVMPCILLVLTVLLFPMLNFSEGLGALTGLCVVTLYYGILYIFRNRIRTIYNRLNIDYL